MAGAGVGGNTQGGGYGAGAGSRYPKPRTTYEEQTLQQKYCNFNGRLNRKPYLIRGLTLVAVDIIVVSVLMSVLRIPDPSNHPIFAVVNLVVMICGLSLTVRRWHDLGKSGFWAITGFIPLINVLAAIYLIFWRGQQGDNQYGPDPLA